MNSEIFSQVMNDDMIERVTPITEYVGTAVGNTVGLVIANLDPQLRENIGMNNEYRSIGFVSTRVGAAAAIWAADDAVKATNTEIVTIQFPRDMKGGSGRGATVIFGADDVSDVRRAVETMLEAMENHYKNIFICDAGHLELHYTARADKALEVAYGAQPGKSFGIIIGAPASIGLVMADTALKTASVEMVKYLDIDKSSYANQIGITITGDSGAVRQSIVASKEVGINVLKSMGQNPVSIASIEY